MFWFENELLKSFSDDKWFEDEVAVLLLTGGCSRNGRMRLLWNEICLLMESIDNFYENEQHFCYIENVIEIVRLYGVHS